MKDQTLSEAIQVLNETAKTMESTLSNVSEATTEAVRSLARSTGQLARAVQNMMPGHRGAQRRVPFRAAAAPEEDVFQEGQWKVGTIHQLSDRRYVVTPRGWKLVGESKRSKKKQRGKERGKEEDPHA